MLVDPKGLFFFHAKSDSDGWLLQDCCSSSPSYPPAADSISHRQDHVLSPYRVTTLTYKPPHFVQDKRFLRQLNTLLSTSTPATPHLIHHHVINGQEIPLELDADGAG